jgi:hypothetical protein
LPADDQDLQYNKTTTMPDHEGYGDDEDSTPARLQLVKELQANVKADKIRWENSFKRMREDQRYAKEGTSQEQFRSGKKYIANIINRYISSRVAKLYAKNPKATYKKRPRRNFALWDENIATIQGIIEKAAAVDPASGMPLAPLTEQDYAILEDFKNGLAMSKMYDGIGDTLVKLFNYYLTEQKPKFKTQMKQLVRRTLINGVGYIKVGYQRELARRSTAQAQIDDITLKVQNLQRMIQDMQEGDLTAEMAEMETLRLQMQQIMEDPGSMEVIREGLVFDFPKSTAIIPGLDCENLVGFIGASRVTHENFISVKELQEMFPEADLKAGSFAAYEKKGAKKSDGYQAARADGVGNDLGRMYGCLWEYYDRKTGMVYMMLEGYCEFLEEPGLPNVEVEGFYPIYTLMLNGIEDEEDIFAKSDVRLMLPMQDEWNRAREGLREHRQNARPRYAIAKGALDVADEQILRALGAHETAPLNLPPDRKITDILAQIPVSGVDPNLYSVGHLIEDMNLVLGANESSMGATSGVTATEVADSAASQMSSIESNADDLTDFMTEFTRDGGQILMLNMGKEQVIEIVGPGAVWPDMTQNRELVAKELFVEIEAGSSGKANKAMDIANFERMFPFLLQIPGLNKEALLREAIKRLDDRLNPSDFVDNNSLSVVAMNAMKIPAAPPGANPPPEQQGANGGANAPGANNEAPGSVAPMGANNQ